MKTTNDENEGHGARESTTPINLYPKLLHRAMECTSTGPRWALAGLLKASDAIGPQCRDRAGANKRYKPSTDRVDEQRDRKPKRHEDAK